MRTTVMTILMVGLSAGSLQAADGGSPAPPAMSVGIMAGAPASIQSSAPDCYAVERGEGAEVFHFKAAGEKCRSVSIIPAQRVDFADRDSAGGKLEFWLRFTGDPHIYQGNKFIFRTEPYPPVATLEIYGSKPFLAFEMEGIRNGRNARTNHRFLAYTEGWDRWLDWKAGEWHKVTLSWKRNEAEGSAELALAIDDSSEGCAKCIDRNGYLPQPGSWQTMQMGNFGRKWGLDYSVKGLTATGFSP